VPRLVEICNQMQVARYLAHMPHPFKRSHAKRFVTFGMENPGLVFGITFDRLLVGALQMRDQLEYFLDPKYWGRGIATCAVWQALDRFFNNTTQDTIETGYFHGNAASGSVLEMLGFVKGKQRTMATRHLPLALYQSMILTRRDWVSCRQRFGSIQNNDEGVRND